MFIFQKRLLSLPLSKIDVIRVGVWRFCKLNIVKTLCLLDFITEVTVYDIGDPNVQRTLAGTAIHHHVLGKVSSFTHFWK